MREGFLYFTNLRLTFEPIVSKLLREDHILSERLRDLQNALEISKEAFIKSNTLVFCESCAERGAKCCGEGLEWKLRPEEFFLNLCLFELKGKSLMLEGFLEGDCLFLGKSGCKLELAPLICRNFFCSDLAEFIGLKGLINIQNALENETRLSFELCQYVRHKLKGEKVL
ncbi:MAG: hypothetical protein N2Z40_07830 [Caldimicrobium sp.]|nr:hypothetical protein [Caldimicrobium sp.]MCX7614105.1 hypothetical protein [Caldimicrobium sp.]MDW8182998.1 hypothetical protein [Caldimicrobium sp.]